MQPNTALSCRMPETPLDTPTRRCPRCGVEQPVAVFFTKGGFKRPYCPPCTRAYKREKYKENPAPAIAAAAEYARNNAAKVAEYQRQYRGARRSELNQAAVVYRQENADIVRAKNRARSNERQTTGIPDLGQSAQSHPAVSQIACQGSQKPQGFFASNHCLADKTVWGYCHRGIVRQEYGASRRRP